MGQTNGDWQDDYYDGHDDDDHEFYYLNFWYDPTADLLVFQMREADTAAPNELECDMCGKQNNPRLREGGSYMCATCWAVWNS